MVARRIAIVNDDQDFVEMVTLILEGEGYEVRWASEAAAALSMVRDWHPHLVLLDIRLRGLSGWEILSLLQDDPACAGTRVLVTSGAVEEVAAARQRLRAGGHDFIALPFELGEFVGRIRSMAGEPAEDAA